MNQGARSEAREIAAHKRMERCVLSRNSTFHTGKILDLRLAGARNVEKPPMRFLAGGNACIRTVMDPITDTAELSAFCKHAAKSKFITVDTEFIREKTY